MVQTATLIIGVAAATMVLCVSPLRGLIVYVAVLAWYPSFLSVPIGTVDLTVTRLVMLAIFLKLFLQDDAIKKFNFETADKVLIVYFVLQIAASAFTAASAGQLIENRAGAAFDMVLPYFAVRLIIQNKHQYTTLLKAVMVISVPLVAFGLWQCFTGHNPFAFLWQYYAWTTEMSFTQLHRSGLFRANVIFPHPIMYGLFFAIFGPVCLGLLRQPSKNRELYYLGSAVMGVGVFTSMSSGPALALLLSLGFILFYKYRRSWRTALGVAIVMCLTVEVVSNRHFYDVLGRFTFNAGTAWYRGRLLEIAFFEGGMNGHWLAGYGLADPGWGPRIDHRPFTDIVNHYVLVLVRYGLTGLIPFIALLIAVSRRLIDAFRMRISQEETWLAWCVLAAFFGLLGAMFSTSLFGQPIVVFYMIMGFAVIMPNILGKKRIRRSSRYRHRRVYTAETQALPSQLSEK